MSCDGKKLLIELNQKILQLMVDGFDNLSVLEPVALILTRIEEGVSSFRTLEIKIGEISLHPRWFYEKILQRLTSLTTKVVFNDYRLDSFDEDRLQRLLEIVNRADQKDINTCLQRLR